MRDRDTELFKTKYFEGNLGRFNDEEHIKLDFVVLDTICSQV
jgi:hypothetical protein